MCCVFFFQAEDGIRDVAVTGVQTCALPISRNVATPRASPSPSRLRRPPIPRPTTHDGRELHFRPEVGHVARWEARASDGRSEEHTSELQSRLHLVCRLLLEKKKKTIYKNNPQKICTEEAYRTRHNN